MTILIIENVFNRAIFCHNHYCYKIQPKSTTLYFPLYFSFFKKLFLCSLRAIMSVIYCNKTIIIMI